MLIILKRLVMLKDLSGKLSVEDFQKLIENGFNACKDLPVFAQFLGVWDDVKRGYESLTPEQRAAFWAAVFILVAKLAADKGK